MTAAKVKTQILHCDHLMNKIIGWRIDKLVDFEYVARWEVRFNRIATQIVEYYAQEKCREQRVRDLAIYSINRTKPFHEIKDEIHKSPLVTTKTDK